jgi:hypothetical protein
MTEHNPNEVPMSASELLASLRETYPAYYKAWKSMVSNNPVASVDKVWRGALGLQNFIDDTSALIDNPCSVPGVKLKRKVPALPFSIGNVYWKLPARMAGISVTTTRAAQQDITTVDSLAALPKEEQEARFNTLMEAQFSGTILTLLQAAELDVLGKLLSGEDIPIPPANKYEDI